MVRPGRRPPGAALNDNHLVDADPAVMRDRIGTLLDPPIVYVPIRHHSPACSRAATELIDRWNPHTVLVEGPPSFDDQIPLLVHPEARMPLAVHSHVVFETHETRASEVRHGSYFPLCDYSPELVALRAADRIGARTGFVDLDYVDLARRGDRPAGHTDEQAYAFSRALQEAAERLGCRDHNELWDQMVEAGPTDTHEVLGAVLAYASLARAGTTEERMEADATHRREAAMARLIVAAELERRSDGTERPLLVVTGAFHSVTLPDLVSNLLDGSADTRSDGDTDSLTDTENAGDPVRSGHGLIRYSFDRLDALSGYSAGMPNPRWYQLGWDGSDEPVHRIVADVAAELRKATGDGQPSLPSVVDAMVMTEQLRRLRGRVGRAARHDVIDATVTCFTKGEDGPANPVRRAAATAMTGFALGAIPPGTPRVPLAVDFDRLLAELRLEPTTSEPKRIDLDVYRSERDRRRSRFLHGVSALNIDFGTCITPLRFSRRAGRDVIRERWTVQLSGATDSALTEASLWGADVAEAVTAKTRAELDQLLEGQPGSSALMRLVLRAAQRGVRSIVEVGLNEIRTRVAHDPSPADLADALQEAELLWSAREPLGGAGLAGLPEIAEQLYLRSCELLPQIDQSPPGDWKALTGALDVLYRTVTAGPWDDIDPALFWEALANQLDRVPPGRLRGAVGGLLWRSDRIDDERLATVVAGHLAPATPTEVGGDVLAGLVAVARDALWEADGVVTVLSEALTGYDDREFLARAPGWRAALAELTPRQTDRLAEAVTAGTGNRLEPAVYHATEAEVLTNTARSLAASRQLVDDGLGHWLDHDSNGAEVR